MSEMRFEKPPRGSVRIESFDTDRGTTAFTASCSRCKWEYTNSVKTDVEWHKRNHSCRIN